MSRVLVIGAVGMLGREIAEAAAAVRGVDVVRSARSEVPGWLRFDAEEGTSAVERLLREAGRLDLIVNCAGLLASEIDPGDERSIRRAEIVNAQFPHELARAARDRATRVVHVSTDAVFRRDAGRSFENDQRFADDVYGSTKRRGEPDVENVISLRCSFVGRDPARCRGLLEWLLAQPPRAKLNGYLDHAWNGLASTQVAAIVAALIDPALFERARAEGPVHHLFEDPPLTKHDLLVLLAEIFACDVAIVPTESGHPTTRILGSGHATLHECLESGPPRAASLEAIAARRAHT